MALGGAQQQQDPAPVLASMDNGVLTVTVPKEMAKKAIGEAGSDHRLI